MTQPLVGLVAVEFCKSIIEPAVDGLKLVNLSIFIDSNFHKQGLGTEALFSVVNHVLTCCSDVDVVYYYCFDENVGAKRMVDKVFNKIAEQNLNVIARFNNSNEPNRKFFEARILRKKC